MRWTANSIEELLGIGGAAAEPVFPAVRRYGEGGRRSARPRPKLKHKQRIFNFNFNHRNRRPPTDPVNAILSLAYSMLAKLWRWRCWL